MIREFHANLSAPNDDQLVGRDYFRAITPGRKAVIEGYLSSLNGAEQETASMIANDLRIESRPLERTAVMIPVAAHQESGTIENAMEQYASQRPLGPFSVVLFPNYPMGSDRAAVDATMNEIAQAQQRHPHLDIRHPTPHEYEEPRIGTIRRDLWNAVMLLAHYEGRFDNPSGEVIGLNHDIDVVRMTPRYVARVQRAVVRMQIHYEALETPSVISRPHATMVKHAHDSKRPNTAKATFWHDFTDWQRQPYVNYDAGMVLPMSYVAQKGSFVREASIGETYALRDGKTFRAIRGTILETSPRRFAERLQAHELDEIWTDDSFDADNTYRVDDTLPDISPLQLESKVINSLDSSMAEFFQAAIRRYRISGGLSAFFDSREKSLADVTTQLERKKHLAVTVLDRVVGLPTAAHLAAEYDVEKYAIETVGDD